MINMDAALVIFLCFFIGSLEASDCPAAEDMWPCRCLPGSASVMVECMSISRPEVLVPPIQALGRIKARVDELRIGDSSLPYLPAELFKGTHIERVHFYQSKIVSLSEHGTPFSGLENILERISLTGVDFSAGLHLDQFRNLKKLKRFFISGCKMNATVLSLPHLSELSALYIESSDISFVSSHAFVDLPNLFTFNMGENKITEMKRSMFPNPAKRLSFIDLSRNMLSSLPKDFFENMPNLRYVNLYNNKFLSLPKKPFGDVFGNNGLETYWMKGNPLHCDCKMSWLRSVRFPTVFSADCATPASVAGKSISSLDFESICNSGLSR